MNQIIHFSIEYQGELVTFAVSLALYFAFERYYPTRDDRIAQPQRRFWGLLVAVGTFLLGITLTKSLKLGSGQESLDRRITTLAGHFYDTAEPTTNEKFYQLYLAYSRFKSAHPLFKTWAGDVINGMGDDVKRGFLTMVPVRARRTMGRMFDRAEVCIVATNVGSREFFLENGEYQQMNQRAFERGVPVVRVYLILPNEQDKSGHVLPEVLEEIGGLHDKLQTVASLVVPTLGAGSRDLLVMDGAVYAETLFLPDMSPIAVEATADQDKVKAALSYIRDIKESMGELTKEALGRYKDNRGKAMYLIDDARLRGKKEFTKWTGAAREDNGDLIARAILDAVLER